MEAATAAPAGAGEGAAKENTGSRTMADLALLAAEKFAGKPALRHKVEGTWQDIGYSEVGEAVSEIARGLIDLGLQQGDRISILAHTRPEWTYASFGILSAGATIVSIYQTNSPEECQYVADHSESKAIFVEDAAQLEKIREVRGRLPHLEHIVIFDPPGEADDAISLADLRERGRARPASDVQERIDAVKPDDHCLFIYTSGTTGPPKGCKLTHENYRWITTTIESQGVLEPDEVVYLFLPLAHAFAILIQFVTVDLGGVIAYWEKDAQKIVPNLAEVKPTYFPSVPRMFEKIYTAATGAVEKQGGLKAAIFRWAIGIGRKVRDLEARGEKPGFLLQRQYDFADKRVLSKVRALFGGNIRQCVTGAAPIAPEILEFFWACGIPVMEGYGMTETSTAAVANQVHDHKFGTVGKPLPGVEIKIAEDGEVLLRGKNIFQGYFKNDQATSEALADGWLHTGDLGKLDSEGFLSITGRKKDIIITAGGKNITPANLENGLKQNRWISQAVVVGDRRPYLVALITLDPDEAPAFAAEHGLEVEALPESEQMRAEVQKVVDDVNSKVGPVEQIKKFTILPHDLSQETGELTPTLKVKRNIVTEKFAGEVDTLYGGPA